MGPGNFIIKKEARKESTTTHKHIRGRSHGKEARARGQGETPYYSTESDDLET